LLIYCLVMSRRAADTSVFHAIADPTRRRILALLRDGERPVAELQRPLRVSQSALSQHLAVLRRAQLVHPRRDGRRRYYRLRPGPLSEVATWMAYFDRFWDARLARLEAYLEDRP
jgi:DNA-binding transcriptional ArsR family regulator